jgi:isopenicillin N synthase-like dioxygenase
MLRLGECVMRAVSFSLSLPLDALLGHGDMDERAHLYRYLSYAPAPPDSAEPVQGIGEHTDYGLLAMLFATSGGLEVKNKAGQWEPAPFPSSRAIVVNAGDVFERMTDGLVPSTWHRVIHRNPEQRLSFPFFFEPPFTDEPVQVVVHRRPKGTGLPGQDGEVGEVGEGNKEPLRYASHVVGAYMRSYAEHAATLEWTKNK